MSTQSIGVRWLALARAVRQHQVGTVGRHTHLNQPAEGVSTTEAETTGSTLEKSDSAPILTMKPGFQSVWPVRTASHAPTLGTALS